MRKICITFVALVLSYNCNALDVSCGELKEKDGEGILLVSYSREEDEKLVSIQVPKVHNGRDFYQVLLVLGPKNEYVVPINAKEDDTHFSAWFLATDEYINQLVIKALYGAKCPYVITTKLR